MRTYPLVVRRLFLYLLSLVHENGAETGLAERFLTSLFVNTDSECYIWHAPD